MYSCCLRSRIANSDPNILVQHQAFIAQQNNFDCSKLITKDQINLNPGTGYTIQLANPFNETDVSVYIYRVSRPYSPPPSPPSPRATSCPAIPPPPGKTL